MASFFHILEVEADSAASAFAVVVVVAAASASSSGGSSEAACFRVRSLGPSCHLDPFHPSGWASCRTPPCLTSAFVAASSFVAGEGSCPLTDFAAPMKI